MRNLRDLLVVGLAAGGLMFATGCDDGGSDEDTPMADMGPAGGEGGAGEGGMGGGAGGEGGAGEGGMGGAGEGGMGGAGEGGMGGEGGGGEGGMGGGGDTEPLGEVNEYGPSSRVTFLDIPADPATAQAAGCTVAGAKAGSALGGLLGLLGGSLSDFVNPDAEGNIDLILLSQLDGWAEGQTGNEAAKATFNLFVGDLVEGEFWIDPDSFEGGDPANAPLISIEETSIADSRIDTPADDISLELPLVPDVPLRLDLYGSTYVGDLRVSADGFDSPNGLLQGYLTKEGVEALVNGIYAGCEAEEPPSICAQLQGVAPTAADALVLVESLVGYDVTFQNGEGADCEADCNATGVCLQIEMTGTKVAGVNPNND